MPNAQLRPGPAAAAWATSLRPTDRQLLDQFLADRDEDAFAELVRRHGPMVLGVCRRVLGDGHAAEDAFQATFLVLVRRSNSLRDPDLLANWLYGVATRTATKARARASRERQLERQVEAMAISDATLDVTMRELQTVLDEELAGLPEKYRAPLVLCYLGGKTNLQAARELGWPEGSISRRLSRGLELLRSRLMRRGVTLSALLLALLLSQESASAAVPIRLVSATAHAAALIAAGKTTAQAGSAGAAELADEVLRTTSFWTTRAAGTAAVLLLLLAGIRIWTELPAIASDMFEPQLSGASTECRAGAIPAEVPIMAAPDKMDAGVPGLSCPAAGGCSSSCSAAP